MPRAGLFVSVTITCAGVAGDSTIWASIGRTGIWRSRLMVSSHRETAPVPAGGSKPGTVAGVVRSRRLQASRSVSRPGS